MVRTLGYYTSYDYDDQGLLYEMQHKYGTMLEGINLAEKLMLLESIAKNLSFLSQHKVRDEMYVLAIKISAELKPHDQEGLAQALIEQIRWSTY